MRPGHFMNTRHLGKILGTVMMIVGCWLGATTESRANAVPDEWDEVFDTARAVLAKLPDSARIEAAITDARLREAVLRTYRDLKACAKVHKDQSRSTKLGTLAEFERGFKALQTLAEQSEYQTSLAKCKTDGATCEKECASARKKLCSCKLTEFGCFVTQCVVG